MAADSARLVYELQITDPSSAEHDKALAKTLLANVLAMGSGHMESPVPAKVEVHIIDQRTQEVVFKRSQDHAQASRTAIQITDDLDHLDATAFARQWGIGVEPAPRPKLRVRNLPRGLVRLARTFLSRK